MSALLFCGIIACMKSKKKQSEVIIFRTDKKNGRYLLNLLFEEFFFFNSVVIPNPCDPSPCANNGTCEDVSGNATCVCPPEYTGPTCEGNISEEPT